MIKVRSLVMYLGEWRTSYVGSQAMIFDFYSKRNGELNSRKLVSVEI